MPDPTGEQPTRRPGEGGTYVPGGAPAPPQGSPDGDALTRPLDPSSAQPGAQTPAAVEASSAFRTPGSRTTAAAEPAARGIDWNSAIHEVGKIASLSGEGVGSPGGEAGFAESGPISFESQWYEWGDYADHMVTKIRRHWYDNMPSLIRMGMKGVVTIQFTIQRSGTITDVRIVKSSEIPPFDFAAKKAIELASPLRPLPADFPNRSERVTAQFYYNLTPARK
jgi:TonB family protein